MHQLHTQTQETEQKLRSAHDAEVQQLKEQADADKLAAKKTIQEISESSKREERLISSALHSIGYVLMESMKGKAKDKAKDKEINLTQSLLRNLAEGYEAQGAEVPRGPQTNKKKA